MREKIILIISYVLIILFSFIIIFCVSSIKNKENEIKKDSKSIMFSDKEKLSSSSVLPEFVTEIGTSTLTTQNQTITGAINEINSNNVLWSGGLWPTSAANQTINLTEGKRVSQQTNGIMLIFSGYSSGVQNWGWQVCVVPKYFVSVKNGKGVSCSLANSNFTNMAAKYVYVYDDKIVGNDVNNAASTANGITYASNTMALRYVIGF